MKLILRKKDSTTSLLLFLFNSYLTKTSKDYIRLPNLIEIMKVFGKNETTTRMALSRAVKIGLLINIKENNEVVYRLTPEGKKYILLWNEGVLNYWKRYQFRNSQWDNKWYLLNVEMKSYTSKVREEIADKLAQYGFVQYNVNTWLTPYHQCKEIYELIEKYNLFDGIIEVHGEMKIHKEIKNFLDEVFCIDKLKTLYQEFIDKYDNLFNQVKESYRKAEFVNNGAALPILHELSYSFFHIAADDVVLPRQLLSEWEGDRAAKLMKNLREMLLEATYKYLDMFS